MRVVSKFAVAFFLAACVCLALYGYVASSREAARLERAITQGLVDQGVALRAAIELAWRAHGEEGADAPLRDLSPRSDVDLALAREPAGSDVAIQVASSGATRRVTVTIPVRSPDGRVSASLRLSREVVSGLALTRNELGAQVAAAVALAAAMALIAAVLGAVVIGRPLGRIVAQARRIGAGDLSGRLKSTGTDEIGALKRELNTMCDRLTLAYERLEEEAAARAATLEQLRHLDRLRTVGTIASSIAHELGTPLNVLLLRGQSLAAGDVSPDEIRDSGRAVVAQVEKMSAIVRQLLDFARARRRRSGELGEVDVGEVAEHACRLLRGMARKQRVELVLQTTPAPRIRGDFEQLEQALTNLIVNGIHAMPNGGTLTVAVSPVEASSEPASVVVEVADRGEGMDEEVLAHIAEPFFTTKPAGEGTGLGLHVARGIAEDHGGSIAISSKVGVGSTVTLELPRRVS